MNAHEFLKSAQTKITFKMVDLDGVKNFMKKGIKDQSEDEANEEGKILFEINCGIDPNEKIEPNLDIQLNEMNKE